jgi:propane monooxygenase reductase subunit
MARIIFEPIREEIECDGDESILEASFRHGYSLVHGCREGQCSACKCYLLDGEVSLKPYSTFALSDSEHEQGYTLLCRAMPDDDEVTVELLHFDKENYRSEHPIRTGRATVACVEQLTHDISRLVLSIDEPDDFDYAPGHYVDLHVPGTEFRRSFSIANLPGDGRIELIIKRYPGGRISGLIADETVREGLEMSFTGPYGAFRLRANDRPILMIAGGSGMAPQLALLRRLATTGCERPIRFFYGARGQRDLFAQDELERVASQLADFCFIPVLSEEQWEGEQGFVHEAVARALDQGEIDIELEAYLCGPPPMVEAASEMLIDGRGIDSDHVHFDKFTTAVADGEEATA